MKYTALLMGVFLTLTVASVFCSKDENINIMSGEELKKRVENPGSGRIFIADTRTAFEFSQGHIPGAKHIPEESFRKMSSFLPAEKEIAVVFYCRGLG